MKIRMKVSMAGTQGVFPAGTVRDLEEPMALHLINVGFAEKVEEEEPKKPKKDAKVSNKNSTSKRTSKSNGSKSTPKARRK